MIEYFRILVGGLPHAAVADLLADITNRYPTVWRASPGVAEIERTVGRWLCDIVGLPADALGLLDVGVWILEQARQKAPKDATVNRALARLYEKRGNFNQAIIYYYSYQLVTLDRRQVIRLAKGKTNRQYLRETGRRGPLLIALVPRLWAL